MAVNLNKDTFYRAAKAKERDYTINDGGGLFLFVGVGGSKLWRLLFIKTARITHRTFFERYK